MSKPLTITQVAERYGLNYWTALNLLHAGAFGRKGKGYREVNPDAKRPTYRVTPAGIEHYERHTA